MNGVGAGFRLNLGKYWWNNCRLELLQLHGVYGGDTEFHGDWEIVIFHKLRGEEEKYVCKYLRLISVKLRVIFALALPF